MKAKKQIIAVGGGGFTHNEDSDLDQFFLDQISKEKCSIGFLPTASNDDSRKTELFYKRFKNCLLYTSPSPRDVEESRMPSSA